MNGKATKQTLQFPLSYNFARDEVVIDDTFSTVESINAPFLNNMISPVYTKSLGGEYVHDADGNRYNVKDGSLYRNDSQLFSFPQKQFRYEEVTEELSKYDSICFHNGNMWTLRVDNGNIAHISGEGHETEVALYENETVVASRISVIEGNYLAVVVYGDYNNEPVLYIGVYNTDTGEYYNGMHTNFVGLKWLSQYYNTTVGSGLYIEPANDIVDAKPVIYISNPKSGVGAVSLVSNGGVISSSRELRWMTFFLDLGESRIYMIGQPSYGSMNINLLGETETITQEVETISYVKVVTGINKASINGTCISSDGVNYYNYDTVGVIGDALDIPTTYTPSKTGNTVSIDGTNYTIYNYQCTRYTSSCSISTRDMVGDSGTFKRFTLNWSDGTSEELMVSSYNTASKQALEWRGQSVSKGLDSVSFVFPTGSGNVVVMDNTKFNVGYVSYKTVTTETLDGGWIVGPTVFLDSGVAYSIPTIRTDIYSSSNSWSNVMPLGGVIIYSGRMTEFVPGSGYYRITANAESTYTVTSSGRVERSNSVAAGQNFITVTDKFNNTSATSSWSLTQGTSESNGATFIELNNSSASPIRYYPGTIRDGSMNYYGDYLGDKTSGNTEDLMVMTVQGYRCPLGSSPWNILYNTYQSGILAMTGLSYSTNVDTIGTLVTPINNVDDTWYIVYDDNNLYYRDNLKRIWHIWIDDGNSVKAILDDRFIVVNTSGYINCYDSLLNKSYHYASDENGRMMFGRDEVGEVFKGTNLGFRYTGNAVNPSVTYTVASVTGSSVAEDAVIGIILPLAGRTRVVVGEERCVRSMTTDTSHQGIDVYYSSLSDSSASYRYTIRQVSNNTSKVVSPRLYNTVYSLANSSSPIVPPSIFAIYVNGSALNDMVKENENSYKLSYSGSLPIIGYSISSMSFANYDSSLDFFVLQGQFYAFMNDKIYSVIYDSSSIVSQEAIVDCRGMKFLGNNTQIAFFYSPSKRAIYSFTGDANLQHIWDASKFARIGYDDKSSYMHWYDEGSQSIFCSTDVGLLVLGPKNTYCYEDWRNVTNIQFSRDSVTHITNNGITYDLVYYPTEGYDIKPVYIETAFYGIGANQSTTIDRWDIVLYDYSGAKKSSYIKAGVRSITDITVKSEEKTMEITPLMYDKWSSSVLVRYVPKIVKAQGIRLYIETPLIIQRIVPHVMDNQTGTLTKRGM